MACWHVACVNNNIGCTPTFKCGHNSAGNYALLDDACPIYSPNTTVFEFGIFENALKTGIVASNNIPEKIVRCFWWGLQNLRLVNIELFNICHSSIVFNLFSYQ